MTDSAHYNQKRKPQPPMPVEASQDMTNRKLEQSKEWWSQDSTYIGQTENEDYGVNSIHARKVNGDWEYACVWHRFGSGMLLWIFKDGKIIDGNLDNFEDKTK